MTLTTTLNAIRAHHPCEDGWRKLLSHLGKTAPDNEPVSFETILESNGIDDALWCLRALPSEYDERLRLLTCDFAEQALHLVPDGEDRPRQAIEVARRFARGEATVGELEAARAAAWDAARAAARVAARETAWAAADAAADAAWDAARTKQEQMFRKSISIQANVGHDDLSSNQIASICAIMKCDGDVIDD